MSDEESRRLDPALDDLTPGEQLAANGRASLRRIAEILSLPVSLEDPQGMRLVARRRALSPLSATAIAR
jgi:hypothetical protein